MSKVKNETYWHKKASQLAELTELCVEIAGSREMLAAVLEVSVQAVELWRKGKNVPSGIATIAMLDIQKNRSIEIIKFKKSA